ncbi:MAG TPA: glycosyltransferase family 4 protein [Emcibacteraceae bacterium]|nr:glycosyltransferase family 4 protein [Emcibacteraceae bacterium]
MIALTEKASLSCQKLGLSKDKIWRRPNPIDDQKFKIEEGVKKDLRNSLTPFSEDQIVISNVAKIMPQKNQFLILEVLTYLPDQYVAVIAGPFIKEGSLYQRDKEYLDRMQAYIKDQNLQSRVCLITDFVDAEKYMKLSDIYAMPAYNEGFGTPMMEAMGCGLPVIANKDETAFQEWIIDGINGYLCDIKHPELWAQAVEKASKFSKEQCLDISENIRKKAGQEAIYGEYMAIITKLLQGGK